MAKGYIREWVLPIALICWAIPAAANQPPMARAGADQTADPGVTVILDGSASTDVDGDSLVFAWSVLTAPAGTTVQITNPASVRPSVVLPAAGAYSFQLIVNDGSVSSAPDAVTITTFNSAPVANSGADQTAPIGNRVVLDGSRSTDVDGNALTYEWALVERPEHSTANLLNADPASPMADFIVDEAGRYIAHLTVRDAEFTSATDATVVSTNNSAPTANAGDDRPALPGEWVDISGSDSFDPDHDGITYRWSLSPPAGSAAVLSSTTDAITGFLPDVPGSYVVQLIVNDGTRDSEPDTVVLSTGNSRPLASGFPERSSAFVGESLYFIGYPSYDYDGDAISYVWSVIGSPAGSTATLSDVSSPVSSMVPDVPGTYVVQLIVNDVSLASEPTTLKFEATIRLPPDEPIITLDAYPPTVNVTPFQLTGSVSEPASLWINGAVVPLDADNRFEYSLHLAEGSNAIDIQAQDGEGNQGSYFDYIWLDTRPPAPPQSANIEIHVAGGQVIVRGDFDAAEPYAIVRITNLRTGQTVQVQASANGAFEAELGGIESDDLSIVAMDSAQNTGEPTVVPGLGSGPLRVEIVAPLAGANVASSAVLVKGALFGPADAGVSVNGQPAVVVENGRTRTFSALVPLVPGTNTITAVAARPAGNTANAQVQVVSNGTAAFVVTATPSAGPAPLHVMFHISEFSEQEIARTEIDLQSNGVVDIVHTNDDRYIPASFVAAGYYEATVTITTLSNQVESTVIPISVQTEEQVNAQIQRVWNAIQAALRAGDAATTLAHFTADAAERYQPVLAQIGSSGLPALADAFTAITVGRISGGIVECVLIRNVAGSDQAFLVAFVRGADGVWRLASL